MHNADSKCVYIGWFESFRVFLGNINQKIRADYAFVIWVTRRENVARRMNSSHNNVIYTFRKVISHRIFNRCSRKFKLLRYKSLLHDSFRWCIQVECITYRLVWTLCYSPKSKSNPKWKQIIEKYYHHDRHTDRIHDEINKYVESPLRMKQTNISNTYKSHQCKYNRNVPSKKSIIPSKLLLIKNTMLNFTYSILHEKVFGNVLLWLRFELYFGWEMHRNNIQRFTHNDL